MASMRRLEVRDNDHDWFTLQAARMRPVDELDAVLMRRDPPFDMNYITYTHMLEAIHPKTLVVNDPDIRFYACCPVRAILRPMLGPSGPARQTAPWKRSFPSSS